MQYLFYKKITRCFSPFFDTLYKLCITFVFADYPPDKCITHHFSTELSTKHPFSYRIYPQNLCRLPQIVVMFSILPMVGMVFHNLGTNGYLFLFSLVPAWLFSRTDIASLAALCQRLICLCTPDLSKVACSILRFISRLILISAASPPLIPAVWSLYIIHGSVWLPVYRLDFPERRTSPHTLS